VRSPVAATPASKPTSPQLSIFRVEVSPLHRNTPMSARMWFSLSNATHFTRSISEKTDRRLGDRFREHLSSTRLPDSDLLVGRHFAFPGHTTQDMLVSVIRSSFRDATDGRSFEARIIFRHRTLHPGGFNADFGFIKSRFKRCEFCLYLSVTLHAQFLVAFKPLMKREYPRNVWFTFKILVRRSELS